MTSPTATVDRAAVEAELETLRQHMHELETSLGQVHDVHQSSESGGIFSGVVHLGASVLRGLAHTFLASVVPQPLQAAGESVINSLAAHRPDEAANTALAEGIEIARQRNPELAAAALDAIAAARQPGGSGSNTAGNVAVSYTVSHLANRLGLAARPVRHQPVPADAALSDVPAADATPPEHAIADPDVLGHRDAVELSGFDAERLHALRAELEQQREAARQRVADLEKQIADIESQVHEHSVPAASESASPSTEAHLEPSDGSALATSEEHVEPAATIDVDPQRVDNDHIQVDQAAEPLSAADQADEAAIDSVAPSPVVAEPEVSDPASLRAAGHSAAELRDRFSAAQMHGVYPAAELHGVYTPNELHDGFDASELHGSFAAADLHGAYRAAELHGVYAAAELHGVFTPEDLHGVYAASELHGVYAASELHNVYSAAELHGVYPALELHGVYTADELHGVYGPSEVREAYTAHELHGAFSAAELHGFYTAEELHGAYNASEVAGVYTAAELCGVYSAGELRGHYDARDLRLGGFTISELREAGFEVAELRDAGCDVPELYAAGFQLPDLRHSFSLHELAAVFDMSELRHEFTDVEFLAAGLLEPERTIHIEARDEEPPSLEL